MLIDQQTSVISIIIPTLNERENIGFTLAELGKVAGIEIIVVDGGSHDGTTQVAESLGARVISVPPGRAGQMNAGAAGAAGEILLFLHADTLPPAGFVRRVRQTLALPHVVAGAFNLSINGRGISLRLIEWLVRRRSELFQLPYGDQAIFLKTDRFRSMGGFQDMPIMEDFEFVRRLRRQGRIVVLPEAASTSARRWRKLGVMRTTLINQAVIIGYFCKVSPTRLAGWYRGRK